MNDEYDSPTDTEAPVVEDAGPPAFPYPTDSLPGIRATSSPLASGPDDYGIPPGPDGTHRHEGIHIVCNSPSAAASVKAGNAESCSMYPGNVPVTVSPYAASSAGHNPWMIGGGAGLIVAIVIAAALFALLPSRRGNEHSRHSVSKGRPKTDLVAFAETDTAATEFSDAANEEGSKEAVGDAWDTILDCACADDGGDEAVALFPTSESDSDTAGVGEDVDPNADGDLADLVDDDLSEDSTSDDSASEAASRAD